MMKIRKINQWKNLSKRKLSKWIRMEFIITTRLFSVILSFLTIKILMIYKNNIYHRGKKVNVTFKIIILGVGIMFLRNLNKVRNTRHKYYKRP
jgi:exopolysaccharide biosynthesis predicted pyruvyltransferase EpsI